MTSFHRIVLSVLAAATAAAVPSLPVFGDQIQLKDGRTLSGSMARSGNEMVIKTEGGETVTTTPDQVVRVTLTSNLTPAQSADAEWSRTAALIKKADDLAAIISLHQKFLDKYPNQDMSASVRTSLGEYQKLDRQKAVKFRGRWMPAAQVEVTLRTWQEQAKPAVELYRSGKVREAFESAKQLNIADDDNPIALTIAGLAAFRLNNLASSRTYFTKLAAADPSSPLAENNLAVVSTQQRSYAEALLHYTRAVQIAPGNRLVLDNIEEAIATFTATAGDKKSTVYRDLVRQFEQAESRMEAQMAQKNLYRYGSTWVGKEQQRQLTTSRENVQAAMAQLDAQYNNAKQNLAVLTDQIAQAANDYNTTLANVNSLNSIANGSTAVGSDVANVATRRDSLMQDLERIRARKTALEAQRDQITAAITDMYGQADKMKQALAGAEGTEFTGLQRMMELGEDLNPPPYSAVPTPRAAAQQTPQPPRIVVQILESDPYQNQVIDSYQLISGPFGFPLFPGIPDRGHGHGQHGGDDGHNGHGGHDGHDGDDDHGGHHPSPPVILPSNGPTYRPQPVETPLPVPQGGKNSPWTAAPQGGANNPWNAAPQGGANSPWSMTPGQQPRRDPPKTDKPDTPKSDQPRVLESGDKQN